MEKLKVKKDNGCLIGDIFDDTDEQILMFTVTFDSVVGFKAIKRINNSRYKEVVTYDIVMMLKGTESLTLQTNLPYKEACDNMLQLSKLIEKNN